MGAMWSGGWGWNSGWGGGNVQINNYNNFNRNANINRNVSGTRNVNATRNGNGTWQHNPQHRGGAPYRDQSTANKYGGTARGESAQNRAAGAKEQIKQQGGNLSSNRPEGGGANRPEGGGANRPEGWWSESS